MKTHHLIQGSPEWHAHRATHWNASDAPAMMGCSPYRTRGDLLKELATGITEDVTPEQQKRFDDGHRFEALARPLAEKIIGEELAPVTGSSDEIIGGRALSASFDGIDFMETVAFEHKSLNNGLRAAFDDMDTINPEHRDLSSGWALPLVYRVQMEQQLMVSGAERILFVASKWDGNTLVEERHCWYHSDTKLAAQIRAGWAQLAADLGAWQPETAHVAPIGKTPETLPALRIEVSGSVTASNLAEYKAHALEVFKAIKRDPSTDDEFADAEKTVKWCGDVEQRLEAAKQHALSQTADIDALFKAIDDISTEARRVRLDLDKQVKARKEQIRVEIVTEHATALRLHVEGLNRQLEKFWLISPQAGFADAIKGKKTIKSIREACAVVLAEAKIMVDQQFQRLQANRKALVIDGRDWITLFADFATVGSKATEDFEAVAQLRINRHIEAEHQAQAAKEAAEAAAAEAITKAQTSQQVLKAEPQTAEATDRAVSADVSPRVGAMGAGQAADAAPWVAPAAAANELATLKLGDICARLGITMTAAFVTDTLKVPPAKTEGVAKLYRESDFQQICRALVEHVTDVYASIAMKKAA